MAVITIREQGQTDTGFQATLVIEGNNYNIIVQDPFKPKEEQELEWYFEERLRYPMLENVKAHRVKESVKKYGEELFKQIFQSDIKAYRKYNQLRSNLNQLQIEIKSKNPEFHAIHWEALQDPEYSRPLAIDTVFIRKSAESRIIEAKVKEFPTINLLVVVARPKEDRDIGHRTISRPLVEAIRNAELPVNIELLRPGTYEALSQHLEAKGKGYYHIVHFDVHGSLQTYQTYQERIEIGMYPESRYGREEIKPYDGVKAFLALEGETKGEYDPVEASEIASLLTSKDIPVCILNACQSAKQLRSPLTSLDQGENEDNRETSLGSRLMNAGMQMVVAMSYSVTVTAAKIMMQQIYQHLFDKKDINQAIQLGRKELYDHKKRRAYYNTEIKLEDWLLPVVYSNGEVNFNLREFTPEEKKQYQSNLDSKYSFTEPTYGFVGRDLDILFIEKALLKHNILLLQGMGGTGKTTLLNYLQEWWQVTKFAEDTFYFAYDKKAYTLQQIMREISKQLYNQFDFEHFQDKNINEQCQELSSKLRNESYILILDNLESVTGQPLAIQNTLDAIEREEIKKFLASLVGGKTIVVLGSRTMEDWLKESTFRDNSYQLRGLDVQARTDLAENILKRVNSNKPIDEIKTDEHFQRLMKLLAGNPLAMKVVLPNLKDKFPKEVLEQLEKAEINPGGDDKESNIFKCIDYSYNNLSKSAQKLLLLLAPFRGFINILCIANYIKELDKIEIFKDYGLENLETAVNQAFKWGVISQVDKDNPKLLTIHPILPYFLNTKLKETDKLIQDALQEVFKNYYKLLASSYSILITSKKAQEREKGLVLVSWEYENIYQGLQICLENQDSIVSILKCLNTYLEITSNNISQLKFWQSIFEALSNFRSENRSSHWKQEIIGVLSNIAKCYLLNRDYKKAKEIYQQVLDQIRQLRDIEPRLKQMFFASISHELGRVTQELREYKQAKDYYQQALEVFIEYRELHSQASTLNELGRLAQELREYQQAQYYYQQALDIKIECGDPLSQAGTLNNLGLVAQELRKFQDAQYYFEQALNINIEYNNYCSQGNILYNLGRVAQQLRELQDAGYYYKEALDIYVEYGDFHSQANTLHNLGIIAEELREYQQAQCYYQQALDIKIEHCYRYSQASSLHQLGSVARELGEFQQSQYYLNQSLDILIEHNAHYYQAYTLHNLGRVSQELREYKQAQDYYQQALSIYIEYGDRYNLAKTYGQWGILAEDLSKWEQAKRNYLQALKIFIKLEDEQSSDLTVINLARLYQKTQDNSLITEVAAILNMTEAEVKKLFEEINNA